MRTADERLLLLHQRVALLQKKKEQFALRMLGGASGALTLCLVFLLSGFGRGVHGLAESGYAATSMLSESAGGYVLVAIVAFAAGIVITLLAKWYKANRQE